MMTLTQLIALENLRFNTGLKGQALIDAFYAPPPKEEKKFTVRLKGQEFIPAYIFRNYRLLAEERYRRITGEVAECRTTDKDIRLLELDCAVGISNMARWNRICWEKRYQHAIVEYIVDALVTEMRIHYDT